MNYEPGPVPNSDKLVREYLSRELRRIASATRDSAGVVFYRNQAFDELSMSAGDSANYAAPLTANVIRISTSSTVTITGLDDKTPYRERVFLNVGTGVLVMKSEGTESSTSIRFALSSDWQLSANASATVWYDPVSSRHRGIGRT